MCYSNIWFKDTFDACLHSGQQLQGQNMFLGENNRSVGASFCAEHNLSLFCNCRVQGIISDGVAPATKAQFLGVVIHCFLRNAWSGWHDVCLC